MPSDLPYHLNKTEIELLGLGSVIQYGLPKDRQISDKGRETINTAMPHFLLNSAFCDPTSPLPTGISQLAMLVDILANRPPKTHVAFRVAEQSLRQIQLSESAGDHEMSKVQFIIKQALKDYAIDIIFVRELVTALDGRTISADDDMPVRLPNATRRLLGLDNFVPTPESQTNEIDDIQATHEQIYIDLREGLVSWHFSTILHGAGRDWFLKSAKDRMANMLSQLDDGAISGLLNALELFRGSAGSS